MAFSLFLDHTIHLLCLFEAKFKIIGIYPPLSIFECHFIETKKCNVYKLYWGRMKTIAQHSTDIVTDRVSANIEER